MQIRQPLLPWAPGRWGCTPSGVVPVVHTACNPNQACTWAVLVYDMHVEVQVHLMFHN